MMHFDSQALFTEHLQAAMCELQRDRIVNVRLALAEVLCQHYCTNPNGGLVQSERALRLMVKHLKLDSSYVSEQLLEVEVSMLEGDDAFD